MIRWWELRTAITGNDSQPTSTIHGIQSCPRSVCPETTNVAILVLDPDGRTSAAPILRTAQDLAGCLGGGCKRCVALADDGGQRPVIEQMVAARVSVGLAARLDEDHDATSITFSCLVYLIFFPLSASARPTFAGPKVRLELQACPGRRTSRDRCPTKPRDPW